jgi:hypothetical protein
MRLSSCVFALSALCLSCCGREKLEPATQFVVSVNSDLEVGTQLTRVEVALYPVEGGDAVEQRSFAVTDRSPREGEARLPFSFGIGRGQEPRFLLEVRGYGLVSGRERETVRQRVISTFRSRETLLLKVFLGSACYGRLCDSEEQVAATCYAEPSDTIEAGSCGPVPEQEAEQIARGEEHDWSPVQGRDAGSELDAESVADDASSEASAPDAERDAAAAGPDAARDAGPPAPVTLDLTIRDDRDDATWINIDGVDQERLHYDDRANGAGRHIEVANDRQNGRSGLRFPLTVPVGATIMSARLSLQRFRNSEPQYMQDWAAASATIQVQVFESPQIAAFDPAHRHPPAEHGPMPGVWATSVKGYRIGEFDEVVESPELRTLVQHVIDKADWAPGRAVTFLLSNDTIAETDYVDFTDSSAGKVSPRLRVVYLPRP